LDGVSQSRGDLSLIAPWRERHIPGTTRALKKIIRHEQAANTRGAMATLINQIYRRKTARKSTPRSKC